LGFLGWIYLVCRFEGYFHVGPEVAYNGDERALIKTLEAWPQDQVLPVILFRSFTQARPPFKFGLVKAKRNGNGWGVNLIYAESDLTRDLLNLSAVLKPGSLVWAPEEDHTKLIQEAFKLSDKLTRWLRGDVGWTAGPKQDVALHDMLTGFTPQYRRQPLTPEMLVH
jgi:hypothetical protein